MFRGGRGGSRYDNFRARIQNTSRPPSMHVDDFVAMESGRGRGRGRGGQSPLNDRSNARPSIRKVGKGELRGRRGRLRWRGQGWEVTFKLPFYCETHNT